MRDIKFIDGEPPASRQSKGGSGRPWTGFVIGVLSQQPGRWALIETGNQPGREALLLKDGGELYGVEVEAVQRGADLYARVVAV